MVFPIGEWLLLSIGFLAWAECPFFRIDRSLRVIPLAWVLGWIVEQSVTFSTTWDWHFPRVFVLIAVTIIAWKKTDGRKLLGILLTGICLLAQDLFVVNEPGIFAYDRWLFAVIFVAVAFFSTHSLWNMALALSGGMLLSMVFTVFLFDGVVRYYNLPNSFLWHFSIGACIIIVALRQVHGYYQESHTEDGIVYRKDD